MKLKTPVYLAIFFSFMITAKAFAKRPANKLRVTTLSTMVADWGYGTNSTQMGEWGYSALVEVALPSGKKETILFDTGMKEKTVLINAGSLVANPKKLRGYSIDLSKIENVILSHHHEDHTGGFLSLWKNIKNKDSNTFKNIYVPYGFLKKHKEDYGTDLQKEFKKLGGHDFTILKGAKEIFPGVWISGPIKALNKIKDKSDRDEQALFVETSQGIVIISGCAHGGAKSILASMQKTLGRKDVFGMIGGWHFFKDKRNVKYLDKLGSYLKDVLKVKHFLGSHCSGIEPVFYLKKWIPKSLIDSVGTRFIVGARFWNKVSKKEPHYRNAHSPDIYVDGINPMWTNLEIIK